MHSTESIQKFSGEELFFIFETPLVIWDLKSLPDKNALKEITSFKIMWRLRSIC
jgi:hypothetical protein